MTLSKEELGKLVKQARKHKSDKINRRYTQVMLANDIKKSQSYIGDIESGRTYPTIKVLYAISEACEVSLDFFSDSKKDDLNKDIEIEKFHANDNKNYTNTLNESHSTYSEDTNISCDSHFSSEPLDLEVALNSIIYNENLSLHGELLTTQSKEVLSNAIKTALDHVALIQQKKEESKIV